MRVRWAAFEVEEGGCASGFFEFLASGEFRDSGCGRARTGSLSAADLAKLDGLVNGILDRLDRRLVCRPPEIVDYSESVMVKTPARQDYRTVFSFNEDELCFRGDRRNAEEFLHAVGEIRARQSAPEPRAGGARSASAPRPKGLGYRLMFAERATLVFSLLMSAQTH